MRQTPPVYLVYRATSPSGKVYIGITSQRLKVRRHQHYLTARRTRNFFQNALAKYGDLMTWDVVESGIPGFQMAAERERHYIALFQSNDPKKGYNLTEGGDTGRSVNASRAASEKRPVLRSDGAVFISARAASKVMGAVADDAVGKAIRNKGTCAGYTFRRISLEEFASLEGIVSGDNPVDWSIPHGQSEESRRKISEAKRGQPCRRTSEGEWRRRTFISKPVRRSDGVLYPSIREAALSVGTYPGVFMYAVQKGHPCGGFRFEILPKGSRLESYIPRIA